MKRKINLETFLIKLYIIILILEAPIRYILNLLDLAIFIYVKDMILILLIVLGLKNIKFNKGHFVVFIIISISFITANIYVGNIFQIGFFILKILIPFLVGMVQYRNILEDIQKSKKFYEICFGIVILGVLLNSVITFPWEGLKYNIGNHVILGNRSWKTVGQKRIAGFSRASYNAATYILFFVSLIQLDNKKQKIMKLFCCIVAIIGIILTTTKGILITCILFYIINFFNFKFNKKFLINILVTIMILLPIFSIVCDPIFEYLKNNIEYEIYIKYVASFRDRLQNTWPIALELATKFGNVFLGRGLGGIGASQFYYESEIMSPADNMFVYMYVTFGVTVLLIIYYIVKKISKMEFRNQTELYVYNIILIICSYGIVVNILEEQLLCILFGSCIGYFLKDKKITDE